MNSSRSRGAGRRCGLLLCVCLVLLPVLAAGQSTPRAHDGGFFMRLALGGGSAASRLEEGSDFAEFTGGGADLHIALGGIVGKNLAVHGTLGGWSISDPDLEVTELGATTVSGDLTMSYFGAGLTYFVMPANVYLSGSLGLATISFKHDRVEVETDTGLAAEISLGKEWWLGNRWGLGAAVALNYHSIPDGDVDASWQGTVLTLRLSATLN
jgi:hypothetical protein